MRRRALGASAVILASGTCGSRGSSFPEPPTALCKNPLDLVSRARLTRVLLATVESGPRNVLLARRAKQLGAAQKVRELAALCRFLRQRRLKAVLEIGAERGGTFWVWSSLAHPLATLITVDLNEPRQGLAGRGQQRVEFVRGDSHDPETRQQVERMLGDVRLDLLFIDGDHRYEGVKQDLEAYLPLVREGGVVVFHDIKRHPPHEDSQVYLLWEELQNHFETREFVDLRDLKRGQPWGGLGVLLVPSS